MIILYVGNWARLVDKVNLLGYIVTHLNSLLEYDFCLFYFLFGQYYTSHGIMFLSLGVQFIVREAVVILF